MSKVIITITDNADDREATIKVDFEPALDQNKPMSCSQSLAMSMLERVADHATTAAQLVRGEGKR